MNMAGSGHCRDGPARADIQRTGSWTRRLPLRLSPRSERVAFWSLGFGTSANWVSTLLAAIWGTGRMTPLAAPRPIAASWEESVVAALLVALSLAMLLGVGLVVRGLFAKRGTSPA